MVEFVIDRSQKPTLPYLWPLRSAVVNIFWTHFLKNCSCSLMFNTIGIQ